MEKFNFKRLTAMLLALVMCFSLLPVSVFAEGAEEHDHVHLDVVTEAEPEVKEEPEVVTEPETKDVVDPEPEAAAAPETEPEVVAAPEEEPAPEAQSPLEAAIEAMTEVVSAMGAPAATLVEEDKVCSECGKPLSLKPRVEPNCAGAGVEAHYECSNGHNSDMNGNFLRGQVGRIGKQAGVDYPHSYSYTSNNNGTHSASCTNKGQEYRWGRWHEVSCTSTIRNQPCEYVDGVCKDCRYECPHPENKRTNVTTTTANCQSAASTSYTCGNCNKVVTTTTGTENPNNHVGTKSWRAVNGKHVEYCDTCSKPTGEEHDAPAGVCTGATTCSTCGLTVAQDTVNGHNYPTTGKYTVSCGQIGYTTYVCANGCGVNKVVEDANVTPHVVGCVLGTVYTDGGNQHYQEYSICKSKVYGNHDYGTYTWNEATGKWEGTCVCGATDSKDTMTAGDDHNHNYTGGDCMTKAKCVCGAEGVKDPNNHVVKADAGWNDKTAEGHAVICKCEATIVKRAAHTYENGVCTACGYGCEHDWKDATCTEPKTCKICGSTQGEANGHDWNTAAWESDGTNHWHECKNCDATSDPEEHDWEPATCKDPKTCKICEATEGDPTDEHDYQWKTDRNNHWKECKVCEAKESEAVKHTFGPAEQTDSSASHKKTCTECGYVWNGIVHTYKNGKQSIKIDKGPNGKTCLYVYNYCDECDYQKQVSSTLITNVKTTTTPATCTAEGTIVYTDTTTNKVLYTDVTEKPLGHQLSDSYVGNTATHHGQKCIRYGQGGCIYEVWNVHEEGEVSQENVVAATCIEGSHDEVVRCTLCEQVLSSKHVIDDPVEQHIPGDTVREKEDPATCTTGGSYDAVISCTRCLREISRTYTTIPATGHKMGEWSVTIQPKVNEAGEAERSCTNGSCTHKETMKLPALGEDLEIAGYKETKAPTCTEDGEATHNETGVTVIIPATGHKWSTKWTIGEDSHWHVCENSGCTATNSVTAHEYKNYTWDETEQMYVGTCECSKTKTQPIITHDHVWMKRNDGTNHWEECTVNGCNETQNVGAHSFTQAGDITKQPTCVDDGEQTWKCSDCEATTTKSVDATGHQMGTWSVTTQPKADDAGVAERTCTNGTCTHKETMELPALGQGGNSLPKGYTVTKEATCTVDGTATHNKTGVTVIIPATGHSWSTEWTAGETSHWHVCENSGCVATDSVTAHEYKNYTWDKENSKWVGTCECGAADAQDTLPEGADHTHYFSEATCTAPMTCACGETEGDALGHNYGAWTVVTPAGLYVAGVERHVCTRCGNVETRDIDMLTPADFPDFGGGDDTGSEVEINEQEVPLAAGPVTRAQFVDYLWRHEGRPEAELSTFVDVPVDHVYAVAIGWGQAIEIAFGTSEDEFSPDDLVTVEQVRLFLVRFAAWKDMDMPVLTTLVGEDDDFVFNCDEVLAEFFGEVPEALED